MTKQQINLEQIYKSLERIRDTISGVGVILLIIAICQVVQCAGVLFKG